MLRLLSTIGFTGKTAEEFFALLTSAGVQQVIDIRQNRSGQLSGFSKHPGPLVFSEEHRRNRSSAISRTVVVLHLLSLRGERGRMPSQKQAKGQRREKGIGAGD